MPARSSDYWASAVSVTARSTSITAPVSRPSGLVPEDEDPGVPDRPRFEQAERLRGRGLAKQSLAASEHDREHHQPELVDEVVLDQHLDERGAAGDEELARDLLLELRDFGGDVAVKPRRVAPRQLLQGRRDDVLRHRVHLVEIGRA